MYTYTKENHDPHTCVVQNLTLFEILGLLGGRSHSRKLPFHVVWFDEVCKSYVVIFKNNHKWFEAHLLGWIKGEKGEHLAFRKLELSHLSNAD